MTLAALAVLVGWTLNIQWLKSVLPGIVTMKPNTAVAFVVSGLALWFLSTGERRRGRLLFARGCICAAVCLGGLSLAEAIFGRDLGIDQVLFQDDPHAVGTPYPGRMAPPTAMNFLLLGIALWILAGRRGAGIAQLLAALAWLIGFLPLVGYLYGVKAFYGIPPRTPMALHTAVLFLLLSAGATLLRPDTGLAAVLAGRTLGGEMSRRALPVMIGIPVVLGWLRLQGQRAGLYDTEFGVALSVLFTVLILAVFVWFSARRLGRIDFQRQQALDEARRARLELEGANRELEAFSYSVSHDLRAPLRGISGFSQAILEDHGDTLDEKAREHFRRIVAASARMGRLIDDLLALSRVSRGELVRERVDLSAVARKVAADLRAQSPDRTADFVIADGAAATGDPRLLEVVMANLLGNAWKFTGRCERARIEFGERPEGRGETYFVRDNGAGFDPSYAQKLFAPFQRLHTADEFPGTGIGLATVQRIVHRHGGRVWAEGAVGQGATVHFTLEANHGTEDDPAR